MLAQNRSKLSNVSQPYSQGTGHNLNLILGCFPNSTTKCPQLQGCLIGFTFMFRPYQLFPTLGTVCLYCINTSSLYKNPGKEKRGCQQNRFVCKCVDCISQSWSVQVAISVCVGGFWAYWQRACHGLHCAFPLFSLLPGVFAHSVSESDDLLTHKSPDQRLFICKPGSGTTSRAHLAWWPEVPFPLSPRGLKSASHVPLKPGTAHCSLWLEESFSSPRI